MSGSLPSSKIEKPVSCQLELTWGCNRRCWFCGIHDIPMDTFRHMPLDLVKGIAAELKEWRPGIRMEFGTGGEPSLNPEFFQIVKELKTVSQIQLMVQTNCEPWCITGKQWDAVAASDWIRQWFEAGGDYLVLNCYKQGLAEQFAELLPTLSYPWLDFYNSNPEHLSMYHNQHGKKKMIFLCQDLGAATKDGTTSGHAQRWFNNQGGSTPASAFKNLDRSVPVLPIAKKCSYPFRQMIINWDGKVPLCCYDWTDRLVLGKFPDQSLKSIWESRGFQVARQLLYRKDRRMFPCATCDLNGGFRLGLLKDPGLTESSDDLLLEVEAMTQSQRAEWEESQRLAFQRQTKEYGASIRVVPSADA